ncbi:MAG: radical SAM family heme chaperone HemW [Candidatus Cloacimonetes bacterium]|jgi:oxygen-independent coproporphyrinogen-3 oxidase|nr:radical SAM family heme chaperone HemW [Candidatus Cloacimonadota bacterium]MDD2650871.1 radical SAM family heme chaperone HemW [Candidatus Cloacimonadota bacterium]MDD3500844.1 radical SAM family heme chaperone HemW [Candidatus Cloacimonadota bacterium]
MGTLIQTNQVVEHLYIHFPFCQKKCKYCSFYSTNIQENNVLEYLQALKSELAYFKTLFQLNLKTVYFGGGTPSLFPADLLSEILDSLDTDQKAEISLECNPNTLNKENLQQYKQAGINRISLGVQSFNDNILKYLGRLHSANDAQKSIYLIKDTGFENYSIDLIYGIPKQTKSQFLLDIEQVINNNIPHISFYCLSLDKDAALYSDINSLPTDNHISKQYHQAQEMLVNHRYKQYEVSNFSQESFESKHNLSYWTGKTYLAAGPSASGYLKSQNQKDYIRYTNLSDLKHYLNKWQDIRNIKFEQTEYINLSEQKKEYIITRLRLNNGINLLEYENLFQENLLESYKKHIDKLMSHNLIVIESNNLHVNPKKYLLLNEVLLEFI